MWSRFILPVSLLSGTIIGAGMFSLPYVFTTAGIGLSVLFAVIFLCVAVFIYWMYADLLRRSPGERYVGLMREYFGGKGYAASFVVDILQLFFALTAYLVLSASFFKLLFPGYPAHMYTLVFWVLSSAMLFVRVRKEAVGEFVATAGIIAIVAGIAALGFGKFLQSPPDVFSFSYAYLLLPFGPLLFSLNGRSVIPELVESSEKRSAKLRKVIVWGVAVPVVLYLLFAAGVLGLNPRVTPDAVSGLAASVPRGMLAALGVLGLLALWSSYIAIGTDIRKTLAGDARMPRILAGALAVCVPLVLYLLGFQSFLALVAITGGVLGALDWAGVALMWRKSFAGGAHPRALLPKFYPVMFYLVLAVLCASIVYSLSLVF
jgi:amino acid permease